MRSGEGGVSRVLSGAATIGIVFGGAALVERAAAAVVRERARDAARDAAAGRAPPAALEAAARTSGDPVVLALSGRHLARAGRAEESREVLARAVARRPLDAEARLRLAGLLAAAGRDEEAAAHVASAARVARNHPALLLHAGVSRLAAWRATGDLAALREAARHFRDAVEREPRLLRDLREPLGPALAGSANLRALLPGTAAAWRQAGDLFAAEGDWESAAAAYAEASRGGEATSQAVARAVALWRAGDAAGGAAALDSAVRSAPDRPERDGALAAASSALAAVRAGAEGEDLLAGWVAAWPADVPPRAAQVRFRLATGDVRGALAALAEMPPAAVEDPDVLDLRADASLRAGQRKAAEGYLRDAVRRDPGSAARWLRLLAHLEAERRLDEALAEADRALGLLPGDPKIREARARILEAAVKGRR
ncbi:MAG: hypothetical protein L0216_06390 [Planctomycetales bacterium]|nr:hypothetical protein [Planctomycetales bacterium]